MTFHMDSSPKTDDKSVGNHDVMLARQLYEQGRDKWKCGRRAEAISLYEASAALDPAGPGATALEISNSIMNFYDKSQLNP